jgi:hypothetical protein
MVIRINVVVGCCRKNMLANGGQMTHHVLTEVLPALIVASFSFFLSLVIPPLP